MTPTEIHLPASDPLWPEVIALFAAGHDIILVGGLMVATFAAEHGLAMPRVTTDIDTLVRVGAVATEPQAFVATLKRHGYALLPADTKSDGHGFRYTRHEGSQRFVVDVLVDGSKTTRAARHTEGTLKPAEIPGGAFALHMPETVRVSAGPNTGEIVRPTLLGALLLKSRAAVRDKTARRDRHLTDLAVLYAAISEPDQIRAQTSDKQRRVLHGPAPAFGVLESALRAPARAAHDYIARTNPRRVK